MIFDEWVNSYFHHTLLMSSVVTLTILLWVAVLIKGMYTVKEDMIVFLIIWNAIMITVLIMSSGPHNKNCDHGLIVAVLYMRTATHRPKVALAVCNNKWSSTFSVDRKSLDMSWLFGIWIDGGYFYSLKFESMEESFLLSINRGNIRGRKKI